MTLQQQVIDRINLCGCADPCNNLKRISQFVSSDDRFYLLHMSVYIGLLYEITVDMEHDALTFSNMYLKTICILEPFAEKFICCETRFLIDLLNFILNYVSNVRKLN